MPTYTKTTWVNGTAPGINATRLNNIETGIETATNITGQTSTTNTGWTATTEAGFSLRKDIAIAGVTSTMFCDIMFIGASYTIALNAHIGYATTYNGGITLYSDYTPSGTVTFDYVITKG